MKRSISTFPAILLAALLITTFHPVAMADTGGYCNKKGHEQMSAEKMQEHMKANLGKLSERLEIKSSQQATWGEFAQSVETLTARNIKKPDEGADAATVSRFRADRATEFARKLTEIANATAKLQTVLTEDQRKILNQASHRFLHKKHDDMYNGMRQRGNCNAKNHYDGHDWDHR